MPSLIAVEGRIVCSECGEARDRKSTWCPTCHAPLNGPPPDPVTPLPSKPAIITRRGCFVCSECGGDVAPKASYCPRCRMSFDGTPIPPAPAVNYHCLACNSDVPAGASFCPRCGAIITHFYAPGEPLSQQDTQHKYIQSLVSKQQTAWVWLIIGLVITFLSWFVCR